MLKRDLSKIEILKELKRDPERKSLLRILYELVYLFFIWRRIPFHYFSRYLFKKGAKDLKDFVPDRVLENLKPHLNDMTTREVLENKLYFDFFYRQFGIALPEILMYNNRKLFIFERKPHTINNGNEFRSILLKIFADRPGDFSLFVKKTSWSYGGYDVYKLTFDQVKNQPDVINDMYFEVIKSGFIFQKSVRQHFEMQRLNSSCLNTIRIDTFMNTDGSVEIMSAYLRTSVKNMVIDNISSGGCQISIGLDSGRLTKTAYLTLKSYGTRTLTSHPVSKVTFEKFLIPHFEEAKELALKAAGYIPAIRLIGWDIAISDSGPVLIEGNSAYDASGNDLAFGGYMKNPVFMKVLAELKHS